MSRYHDLETPLTLDAVRALRAGDLVTISGEVVVTAGLPTHRRILDCIESGSELPVDLAGAVLLQFGGMNRVDSTDGSMEIRYMNPTTSTRFNAMMPAVIRGAQLRAVGGKGGLDAACAAAMRESGCVYLSFPGGACTLYSQALRGVSAVEWRDLIPHYRLMRIAVERLGPATVGIDAHGNSLYAATADGAASRLPDILDFLDEARHR